MARDISEWLVDLGLGKYADTFAENEIDFDTLPHISDEDLKEIGIALGARRKLLVAVSELESKIEPIPSQGAGGDRVAGADAERRQLTVMFCDLTGSTALSERLDPEDLREVLLAYQENCSEIIRRYEGHIAKYIGDGLLVYFGYPQAHEDDAQRAVRAGLKIVAGVAGLSERIGRPLSIDLAVHLGIHTGLVVAGEMGAGDTREEMAIVGETPNIAARLEGLATPGSVLISESTHNLIEGLFVCEALGPQSLKGISEPVGVYRVQRETDARSRFEATHRTGLTPLVGREHEIGLLLDRWEQAKEGDGQVVFLSGEAGIGKSRITETLQERSAGDRPAKLLYQCSPHYTNTALHPVIEQLERAAQFEAEDASDAKLDKLESLLKQGTADVGTLASLFAPLLSISTDGRYWPLEMTPERQKQETLEALVTQMEGLSSKQPMLLIFEDIHWADPTSLELLGLTIDRTQSIPVLVILTYRPEFMPPWSGYTHVTSLTLNRFARSLASTMVEKVTGGKPLPDDVLEQIIEKTDGVPLFVEELTKTILESGQLTGAAVPATLHDSLMARLDRLGQVKEVAQTASAIGRVFGFDLLATVSPLNFAALHDALEQLVDAELVFRHTHGHEEAYIFKHALVRDAAYQSLLKSTRRQLHLRIAEALESRFPEKVKAQPELLAHHFTEAGNAEAAVKYWLQAGSTAAKRAANQEAIGHLTAGLSALPELPESTARSRLELDFRMELCGPYLTIKGWGGEETAKTFSRARELCTLLGETEQLPPVLYGEYMRELSSGRFRPAREIAAELLRFGEQHHDADAILQGRRILGWGALYVGEFSASQTHIDEALRLYNPEQHGGLKLRYAHDTRVAALSARAIMQCVIGHLDQANTTVKAAIDYARRIDHAPSLAYALMFAGTLPAALRADPRQAAEFAEELIVLSDRLDSVLWLGCGRVMAGWSVGVLKPYEDGVRLFLQGLENLEATAPNPWKPLFLTLLAEIYVARGETDQALHALNNAIQHIERTDERMWASGVHILLGKALLAQDPPNTQEAESSLQKAIQIAHRQGAKSLELRAATSIAGLWQSQDKRDEARSLLKPLFDWFTEGLDTPDLKQAKALLEQLS
jgi:class 3 adenylate cyclase/predicted ATPase